MITREEDFSDDHTFNQIADEAPGFTGSEFSFADLVSDITANAKQKPVNVEPITSTAPVETSETSPNKEATPIQDESPVSYQQETPVEAPSQIVSDFQSVTQRVPEEVKTEEVKPKLSGLGSLFSQSAFETVSPFP